MRHVKDLIKNAVCQMQAPNRGVMSGFDELDSILHGFQPGELTVIAARPSLGKTSIMLDMSLCTSQSVKTTIVSVEMSSQILLERMLVNKALVSLETIRSSKCTEDQIAELNKQRVCLEDLKLALDCDIRDVTSDVFSKICEQSDVVFIDYLQLLKMSMLDGQRYRQIDEAVLYLKRLAKEYSIPIVLLAQLNRNIDNRDDKTPRLSDLRESAGIEQTADNVIFLHRPAYYAIHEQSSNAEDDGECWLIVAKHRNGKLGRARCVWLGDFMSFRNMPANFREFGGTDEVD